MDLLQAVPKKRSVRLAKRSGVIYHNPSSWRKAVFYLGTSLTFVALLGFVYLYYPLTSEVTAYYYRRIVDQESPRKDPDLSALLRQIKVTPIPPMTEEIKEYFIDIPKINAKTKVELDVSPFDRKEYDLVLKKNVVALAKGSSRPGSGRGHSSFIFAHSSEQGLAGVRNNPVFYLLGQMEEGDDVFIYGGSRIFKYKVYDKVITAANDTDYIYYSDPAREVVVLQTCWPIGTNWRRLLILAELRD